MTELDVALESYEKTFDDSFPMFPMMGKEANEVVGFAGISVCLDEATLSNIVVKKSCRGRGIGGELLESLIDICSELNLKTFTLEVNTKNEPAIHLYEKFGFVEVPL